MSTISSCHRTITTLRPPAIMTSYDHAIIMWSCEYIIMRKCHQAVVLLKATMPSCHHTSTTRSCDARGTSYHHVVPSSHDRITIPSRCHTQSVTMPSYDRVIMAVQKCHCTAIIPCYHNTITISIPYNHISMFSSNYTPIIV